MNAARNPGQPSGRPDQDPQTQARSDGAERRESAPENGSEPNPTGGGQPEPRSAKADTEQKTEQTAEQLRDELELIKDRALRAQAELENYRRRATRELQEQLRYANMPLFRDLLPVIDNIGRAIEAAESSQEAPGLLAGFKMVAQQLDEVLRQHHCTRIDALHEPFDPNLHEAIAQQPSDQLEPGTVMHVTQTGYTLHDRVVRPSQVVVSSARPEQASDQADSSSNS